MGWWRPVIHQFVNKVWYRRNHPLSLLLAPFGWLFTVMVWLRRCGYATGLLRATRLSCPVVVVGNLTVGGTGKTPLVAWLATLLRDRGHNPGLVCRGYGGVAKVWPQQVRPDSDPIVVGDESVLLARLSGCPVAAGPDRVAAARALLEHTGCDLVISDDGLQHLRLGRDIEIAVVDGIRRHGNGRCLPAGPLREPVSRLNSVDIVVANDGAKRGEFEIKLLPVCVRNLLDESLEHELNTLRGGKAHVVCGIGNPARFFRLVESFGVDVIPHEFPDHFQFSPDDIRFEDELPVLMTEKDAVKCRRFADPRHWYMPMVVQPHHLLDDRIVHLLEGLRNG